MPYRREALQQHKPCNTHTHTHRGQCQNTMQNTRGMHTMMQPLHQVHAPPCRVLLAATLTHFQCTAQGSSSSVRAKPEPTTMSDVIPSTKCIEFGAVKQITRRVFFVAMEGPAAATAVAVVGDERKHSSRAADGWEFGETQHHRHH